MTMQKIKYREAVDLASLTRPTNLPEYRFEWKLLTPRYWGIWFAYGLIWLITRLPVPWVRAIGYGFGKLLYPIGGKRRKIVLRNLELCFPEKSVEEREALARRNFERMGYAALEPGLAWWSSPKRLAKHVRVENAEYITPYLTEGKGIMLFAPHILTLEMTARVVSERMSFNILYRAQNNDALEYITGASRVRHGSRFIPRKQVKDLLYFMHQGEIGAIMPDHDLGKKRSLFVPHFGIQTAWVPSTGDFARQAGTATAMVEHFLDDDNCYVIRFSKPLENFPTDDPVADTARIADMVEATVRAHPDQYLWAHRRFKTRPPGEPKLY